MALSPGGMTSLVGGATPRSALVYTFTSGAWSKSTFLRPVPLSGYDDNTLGTSVSLNAGGTMALVGTPGWELRKLQRRGDCGRLRTIGWDVGPCGPAQFGVDKASDEFGVSTARAVTGRRP